MHEISGTVFHRWYVTIFGLAFLFFAVRQLGWRKTLLYGVLAFGVGALAENGSTHVGFPYTTYSFNPALRGQLGFALTSLVLLTLLFWLSRGEPDRRVDGGLLRHPHLGALITWHAQVFHMAVIAFVVGADAIGGSAFLMWVPAAAVTAVY